MRFEFEEVPEWPPLAWIAQLAPRRDVIHVRHGSRVETGDGWFCEAGWAGDYGAADFDQTDRFFGSGARIRGNAVTFVPSASTVDRLQSIEFDGHTYVSNSLASLMQRVEASVDPTEGRYYEFFGSIVFGLHKCDRFLQTSAGTVTLTYFHNLRWDGRELSDVEKPHTVDGFRSFDEWHGYMRSSVEQIARNLADPRRRFPHKMLGTLSSGYDSTFVTTIAREFGLTEVLSFSHVKKGQEDSGAEVARVLGLDVLRFGRQDWKQHHLPEVPFTSTDAKGEDVYFRGAERDLLGRAVMTGFLGDKVYEKDSHAVSPYMIRHDRSGLSLSEYRLWAGFIHCPVPYLGARRHPDIHALSNSKEMEPWDVGGEYNRPLQRRVIESAGIPRGAFGVVKIGTSIVFRRGHNLQSPSTIEDFGRWLRGHAGEFWRRGTMPPHVTHNVLLPAQWVAQRAWGVNERLKSLPRPLHFVRSGMHHIGRLGDIEHLARFMFPWAIERAKQRYSVAAREVAPARPTASPPAREPIPST